MSETWNGIPDDPEESGWHWVEDGDGLRPLMWRGEDWPDAVDRHGWRDGFSVLSPEDLHHARYHGRVAMPPGVAERFRLNVMFATA
ncbi:hypothetical protein HVPorG_00747 [Roseomonas mucosa]|jgi:hypothetical protein|uniref:Uncharacterized protein n=1 Tax=Roseomonas mucosa TaxID=207340 RepID=A0A1S8D4L7_9PROT|nr:MULTISPECIES: hypothetical protein [Roseomonas]MBS5903092.1 hypothetical protein [Acetobacteraceae bacterium]MDT8267652.1 hypothetical protein [Roseomonas sp. DSM 102946]ATR21802.1 hypothetical protein CTJ15_16840 [Roseomonas sp. FDAARGOS_362]AWV21467.1 hypothetical protein RADP37_00747 [Roseomonas mucosa]MCG7352031.1 hypothetical protein [Roseomonas mucosa]